MYALYRLWGHLDSWDGFWSNDSIPLHPLSSTCSLNYFTSTMPESCPFKEDGGGSP